MTLACSRPLVEIKKKGRPPTQCSHCRELRKTKRMHVKCVCAQKGAILPNVLDSRVAAAGGESGPASSSSSLNLAAAGPGGAGQPSATASTSSLGSLPGAPSSSSILEVSGGSLACELGLISLFDSGQRGRHVRSEPPETTTDVDLVFFPPRPFFFLSTQPPPARSSPNPRTLSPRRDALPQLRLLAGSARPSEDSSRTLPCHTHSRRRSSRRRVRAKLVGEMMWRANH